MNKTWLSIDKAAASAQSETTVNADRAIGRKKSSALRKQILSAAQSQFLVNGYAGTSIDSIVKITGGSKSTIYGHFRNKEDLFAAVIHDIGHEAGEADFPVRNSNLQDELTAFAENRLKRALSPMNIRIMRIVIAEAERLPQVAGLFYRNAPEPTYLTLREYFEKAVASGLLTIDDLDQAVETFIGGLLLKPLLAALFGATKSFSAKDIRRKAEVSVSEFLLRCNAT